MPMTATKLADLQKAALVHTQKAREIVEANADKDPHDWSDDDRKDYDAALAKGREKLDEIKVAKADLDVLGQAKALADEIGLPSSAKDDLDAQGNKPIRERVKALGLQVVEAPEFKAMMAPFAGGRIPEKQRIQSDPISIKGLFVGGTDTSAGAFVVNEQTGIVEMLGRKELTIRVNGLDTEWHAADLAAAGAAGPDGVVVPKVNSADEVRAIEKALEAADPVFYVPSLSASTIVYKGMVMPQHLGEFYADLVDPPARAPVDAHGDDPRRQAGGCASCALINTWSQHAIHEEWP